MGITGSGRSYLWVEFVDLLDRRLDVTRMNGRSNFYSFVDRLDIRLGLNIGLDCKLLRSGGIAVGDEVVHD